MARLKAPPPTPAGSVPPELRNRFDPIWSDPAAITAFYRRERLGYPPERTTGTEASRALDRHRDAVTAWCEANGMLDRWGKPDPARLREAGITVAGARDRLFALDMVGTVAEAPPRPRTARRKRA